MHLTVVIYHQSALKLLNDTSLQLFISTKNIIEYFAVCSKLSVPFQQAIQFYSQIRQNTTLLFPTTNSLAIFENLLQKYQPKGNQIFDLEIVSIALANQVADIATFNTKDFAGFSEINLHTV